MPGLVPTVAATPAVAGPPVVAQGAFAAARVVVAGSVVPERVAASRVAAGCVAARPAVPYVPAALPIEAWPGAPPLNRVAPEARCAADQLVTRTGTHPNFGRIVFDAGGARVTRSAPRIGTPALALASVGAPAQGSP